MLNPRCWRIERFLVLTNAHHVERLPSSWCGKTQIARIECEAEPSWPSGIRAAGLIWNTLSAKSWLTLTTSVRVLYNTSAVILLWCINFRFNNYSIHNYDNAGHCIQYQYRWLWCCRVRCIPFGAVHPSLRWAATCHVRILLPGPEGVRSWQVLLYKCSRTVQYLSCYIIMMHSF